FALELTDLTEIFRESEFRAFSNAIRDGGVTKALRVPAEQARGLSRKNISALEEHAKLYGAGGLAWIRRTEDGFSGPIAKFLDSETADLKELAAEEGDLLLFVTAPWNT